MHLSFHPLIMSPLPVCVSYLCGNEFVTENKNKNKNKLYSLVVWDVVVSVCIVYEELCLANFDTIIAFAVADQYRFRFDQFKLLYNFVC